MYLLDTNVWLERLLGQSQVETVMNNYDLDFDDAYQYVAAEREQATLVSFDRDFDRTSRGRQTPSQVLEQR